MAINYSDLNPTESEIELNSVTFQLRPFDLTAQTWAFNHFATADEKNGLTVLTTRIQDVNDFDALLDTIWHLLKGKMHFNNSKESFFKAVEKLDHKYIKSMEMRTALNECLGVSQPMIEEFKGDIELKKSLTAVV